MHEKREVNLAEGIALDRAALSSADRETIDVDGTGQRWRVRGDGGAQSPERNAGALRGHDAAQIRTKRARGSVQGGCREGRVQHAMCRHLTLVRAGAGRLRLDRRGRMPAVSPTVKPCFSPRHASLRLPGNVLLFRLLCRQPCPAAPALWCPGLPRHAGVASPVSIRRRQRRRSVTPRLPGSPKLPSNQSLGTQTACDAL